MKITATGKTDIGRRGNNEDSYLIDHDKALFLVCDGVGSNRCGEVASSYACETIQRFWGMTNLIVDYSLNEKLMSLPADANKLITAARITNQRIYRDALQYAEKRGMTTTVAGLIVNESGYAIIMNVGDSRVYRFRNDILEQMSQDNTYVNELLEDGEITQLESEIHPDKNVISRALGAGPNIKIDIYLEPVSNNDVFLICSDGLSGVVPAAEIQRILHDSSENLDQACDILIDAAKNLGGKDNITVVIARVNDITPSSTVSATNITVEENEKEMQLVTKLMRIHYKTKPKIKVIHAIIIATVVAGVYLMLICVRPPPFPPRPKSMRRILEVNTEPTNATLLLNGQEIGLTPTIIKNLQMDSTYKITVTKYGYFADSVIYVALDTIGYWKVALKPEAIVIVQYQKSQTGQAGLVIDGVVAGLLKDLEGKIIPLTRGSHIIKVTLTNKDIFLKKLEVVVGDVITIVPDEIEEKYRIKVGKTIPK